MKNLKKLSLILGRRNIVKILLLLPFLIFSVILETFSIGLVVPLVSTIFNPQEVNFLSNLTTFLDLDRNDLFNYMLLLFAFFFIFKALFSTFFYYYSEKKLNEIRLELQHYLFNRYLLRDFLYHLSHNRSEIINNNNELGTVFQSFLSPLIMLTVELFVLIGVLSLLLFSEPIVTSISVLLILLMTGLMVFLLKPILNKMGKARVLFAERINKSMFQGLGAITEVKVHKAESFFSNRLFASFKDFLNINLKNSVINYASGVVMESLFIVLLILVIYFLGLFGSLETSLPLLALFVMASIRILQSSKKIGMSINLISYSSPALELVNNEFLAINDIDHKPLRKKNIKFNNKIELKNISFSYPDTPQQTLKNITITFQKNSATAIIGKSGSGKTTLVNILLNLLRPTKGDFFIDEIKNNNIEDISDLIGYVPQSVYILDDSIRNNIAFGEDLNKIDDDKIIEALRMVDLLDYVLKLPNKLNTILGEDGSKLSGGQKQRIGIARAIYHDSSIIVFDEMTSALDSDSTRKIMEVISELKKMKTIIIISHKISSLQLCDKIYILEDGEVKTHGTYSYLKKKNKSFQNWIEA